MPLFMLAHGLHRKYSILVVCHFRIDEWPVSPFVVSLSNHEPAALRQAQGERNITHHVKVVRLPDGIAQAEGPRCSQGGFEARLYLL